MKFTITLSILFFSLVSSGQIVQSEIGCDCIDYLFSSSENEPIVSVKKGNNIYSFCGYSYGRTGYLRKDSSFIGSGYSLIDCSTNLSIFSEGEYYHDSVQITSSGFRIFRLSYFPNPLGGRWIQAPIIEFVVNKKSGNTVIDTAFSLPTEFYSTDYLEKIQLLHDTTTLKNEYDLIKKEIAFNLLFLKALKDRRNIPAFMESGPYDGFLGPIFRDQKKYLRLRWKNGG